MVLNLTENELRLVRTALVNYSLTLRDEARPLCSGYSLDGIALCQRRIEVDVLIDGLDSTQTGSRIATDRVRDCKSSEYRPYVVSERAA
jgi:hypothetical protein